MMIDQNIWDVLRPEIRWVAMDRDGIWGGYVKKPWEEREAWNSGERPTCLECIRLPTDIDWRESLHERPVEQQDEKPYVVGDAHRAYVCAILPSMIEDWDGNGTTLDRLTSDVHKLARALREAEKTV